MRRIYFLAPNIEVTHKIVDELRASGIADQHMHVLAKRDTPLEDLPEANELQRPVLRQSGARCSIRCYDRFTGWFCRLALCWICNCRWETQGLGNMKMPLKKESC